LLEQKTTIKCFYNTTNNKAAKVFAIILALWLS